MINLIKEMVINESVADVLRYFGPKRHISQIDRIYTTYNFEVIYSGALLIEYKKLFTSGELAYDASSKVVKGPNWKEPEFVTKGTYLNIPGKAVGVGRWAGESWFEDPLVGSRGGVILPEIADQLRGNTYNDCEEFQRAIWKAFAAEPLMTRFFSQRSVAYLSKGFSPYCLNYRKCAGREKLELDYEIPLCMGGYIYDIDNICVFSPALIDGLRFEETLPFELVIKEANKITNYTEAEFLALATKICTADFSTEKEADAAVSEFVQLMEHPEGTDIVFWFQPSHDDSPEGLVECIKEWRIANGKPLFKAA